MEEINSTITQRKTKDILVVEHNWAFKLLDGTRMCPR